MLRFRLTSWLRPLLLVLAVTGVLSLAACGGGGGSINNPNPGPPGPSAVTVFPPSQSIYAGTPSTITVSGGLPPYRAFSSNSAVLPVAQNVATDTIVLLANAVIADTTTVVTVQDAIGQTAPATVVVRAAVLFPSGLQVLPSQATCGGNICTGATGTASVQASGVAGSPLAGRQIRFDVVYGAYGIINSNPAQPLVQTQTAVTDGTGRAQVGLQTEVNVATQPAQIRATDLTSGQQQTGNFTIIRDQNAGATITVVPENANITGPDNQTCSAGFRIDYFIYGGTPPYRVTSTFPLSVTLVNSIVIASGDFFTAITNGSCVDPLVFSILDSAGKQTTALLTNIPGTTPPPAPPPAPPPPLNVTPGSQGNQTTTCTGKTYNVLVSGGTPGYNVTFVPPLPATGTAPVIAPAFLATPGTVAISGLSVTAGSQYNFRVFDSATSAQSANFSISCGP